MRMPQRLPRPRCPARRGMLAARTRTRKRMRAEHQSMMAGWRRRRSRCEIWNLGGRWACPCAGGRHLPSGLERSSWRRRGWSWEYLLREYKHLKRRTTRMTRRRWICGGDWDHCGAIVLCKREGLSLQVQKHYAPLPGVPSVAPLGFLALDPLGRPLGFGGTG